VQIGQVAVALVEIEAVTDEELVGDGEAHVANWEVFDQPAVGAIEERDCSERGRLSQRQRLAEVVERQTRIDDVLDDEGVAPDELGVEVFQETDPGVAARVCPGGIARELDEVEPMMDRDGAREVGNEDDARLQRRDEQRLEPFVVTRDVTAELADARAQLPGGEVNLAEARLLGYDASSSRYRSARRSMSRL
jgi:hypothetical protein